MSTDALSTTMISTSERGVLAMTLSRQSLVNTRLLWVTTTMLVVGVLAPDPHSAVGNGAPSTDATVSGVRVVGCRRTTERSNPAGKASLRTSEGARAVRTRATERPTA